MEKEQQEFDKIMKEIVADEEEEIETLIRDAKRGFVNCTDCNKRIELKGTALDIHKDCRERRRFYDVCETCLKKLGL